MKLPDDYCLIRPDGTKEDNFWSVYGVACEQEGAPNGHLRNPAPLAELSIAQASAAIARGGKWLYSYIDELERIEKEALVEVSILGDRVRPIKAMDTSEALKVIFVSIALIEVMTVKREFLDTVIDWGQKKLGRAPGTSP